MSEQRVALVTGASRGIGAAICHRLLLQGWQVTGIARCFTDPSTGDPGFQAIELDLSDLDQLPRALGQLRKRLPPLDALICNAGSGRFGALEQFSAAQIRSLIDLNLTSQILLAREFLPQLKRQQQGNLIFMGSEAALRGGRNGAVYSASKFALRGLAQALREECAASGVRVGIINPGMVRSDFFNHLNFAPGEQEQEHLTCEDVAGAAWLMINARPGAVIDEINLSPQKRVIDFR